MKYYSGYKQLLLSGLISLALLITGCKDNVNLSAVGNELGACNSTVEKQELLQIMQQWYLWNDEAEQAAKYSGIDINNYGSADELLNFLRYRPTEFDRGFSFITTPQADAAFAAGQFIGFGFSLVVPSSAPNTIIVSQVYAGGPAASAGIERGYTILSINGRSTASIINNEGINTALGPAIEGLTVGFTFADRSSTTLPPVSLSKAVVDIDPVPVASIIRDSFSNPIAGYIVLRSFVIPAEQQLRDAFALFTTEGVSEIIVDLRYNGGGLISTAGVFGSLLAGPGNAGNVFTEFNFNSARADANSQFNFTAEPNAITLNRIVFITTGNSASASELLINSLEPYFTTPNEVVVIGQNTFGKPVGQSGFSFCAGERLLRPITFSTRNVLGQGDYFNGLPVDCSASDDLTELLGDSNEAMLANAISYIENDACPSPVITTASTGKKLATHYTFPPGQTTVQRLFGAY